MKITLIGAGNLATNLGKSLHAAGHDFIQVYSRTMEHASELAAILGGSPTDNIDNIKDTSDVYIFSVKDSALVNLIPRICKDKANKVFLHTAGSMPMDVFEGMALHYGVFYPMQTFSKEREVDFSVIPCFIEANDKFAKEILQVLTSGISEHIFELSSEDRKYLHLSAVFACNFVNHCYDISARILQKCNIPFDVMLPLIDETAKKVHDISPADAQTGPAVRYDENVIRAQSAMLKNNPLIKDVYERLSLSIHRESEKNKEK